jgi:hypothetical protein
MIQSHERSKKTIYSGLRITGMAFSNHSELPAFFSPRANQFKN